VIGVVVDVWHCPKCGAELESAGVISLADQDCSVFQCDCCVVVKPFMGKDLEFALTFAVSDSGRPFDPVDEELF
jgi:uncharacterized protein (UPF0212 family)